MPTVAVVGVSAQSDTSEDRRATVVECRVESERCRHSALAERMRRVNHLSAICIPRMRREHRLTAAVLNPLMKRVHRLTVVDWHTDETSKSFNSGSVAHG